jgi:hypothetical protein
MMLECPVFRHAVPSQNLSCGGNRRQGPSAGIPSSDFLRKGFSYEDKNSDEAGNHGGTSIVRWHGGLHCHNDPMEYN